MATYYLDGNTLANSAAVYTNVNLTSCAPDGYYSDGVISRQQIGCVLSPANDCIGCGVVLDCDQILIANDTAEGVYSISTDINSTSIGAVVITFKSTVGGVSFGNQPLGVRAIYNNVTYNELSEPMAGYHASSSPANFTFVSPFTPSCSITGVTFPSVPSFYYDGLSFFTTGATQSISVAASDVSTVNYVAGRMVVPKITTSPDMLMFEIASLCDLTSEFQLEVSCPISLTGFGISAVYSSPPDQNFCNNPILYTAYNVPVSSPEVYGVPGLFDWVFSDPNGEYVLADGYYLVQHPSQYYIIEVGNGVVSQLLTCP